MKRYEDLLKRQLVNELTEAEVYTRLARHEKNPDNARLLERIGEEERAHAGILSGIVGGSAAPDRAKVRRLVFFARCFGLTFSLKMMERGENLAGKSYRGLVGRYPALAKLAEDEERHELELIGLLKDRHLENMGSIVLGLNDALVELTGALAGFTFALGQTLAVAKLGFITGMAAAMSMAASAFLSARAASTGEKGAVSREALVSALYTGGAYVVTVILLVAPYLLFPSLFGAFVGMLCAALGIIAFFNFYLSVARGTSFWRGFLEMAGISTFVALVSYFIGSLLA
jgi:VIT1/CCC1 family predicted Fe2+/Mn2+ transporter